MSGVLATALRIAFKAFGGAIPDEKIDAFVKIVEGFDANGQLDDQDSIYLQSQINELAKGVVS